MFLVAVVVAAVALVLGLVGASLALREHRAAGPVLSAGAPAEPSQAPHPSRAQWRAVRRRLPPTDAGAIVLAQLRGRPVSDPRLAAAAQLRGRWAVAESRRAIAPGSDLRRVRWPLAGGALLQVALVFDHAVAGDATGVVLLVFWSASLILWVALPALQQDALWRVERSLAGTPTALDRPAQVAAAPVP